MSDDEWQLPAPREDPETRGARLVKDDKGGVRLVPEDNIVEGEIEEGGTTATPSCPFSSP